MIRRPCRQCALTMLRYLTYTAVGQRPLGRMLFSQPKRGALAESGRAWTPSAPACSMAIWKYSKRYSSFAASATVKDVKAGWTAAGGIDGAFGGGWSGCFHHSGQAHAHPCGQTDPDQESGPSPIITLGLRGTKITLTMTESQRSRNAVDLW
jgi:hypothetical protein